MILTTKDKVLSIAERWLKQYRDVIFCRKKDWFLVNGKRKAVIYDELKRLSLETASREDVDTIIGNSSWTVIICDVCSKDVGLVVVFEDKDHCCVQVCEKCMKVAFEEMKRRND